MDMMLNIICKNECIYKEQLYSSKAPNDLTIVLEGLVSDGMIEDKGAYYSITQKGRMMMAGGGYMSLYKKEKKENIGWICGIVSAFVSILALILSFL